jgi:alginate O-acetyltransferase complex protein AlgI
MATMLLGGLWHGASWTFVAWGGLHGVYLAAERWLRSRFSSVKLAKTMLFQLGAALLTYLLVNITWVFFRAQDFPSAWRMLRSMFGVNADVKAVLPAMYIIETLAVTGAMLAAHWSMRQRRIEDLVAKTPWWLLAALWGAMVFLIIITQDEGHAFIYFQF